MRWVIGVTLALVATIIIAFHVQNSSRVTALSLDLWFAAWKTSGVIPVPVLIWACLGVGLGAGYGVSAVRASQLERKVRRLEQELALSSRPVKDSWGG